MADILVYQPILFIRIVTIVIFSVTIHELSHGLAALLQGDDTPKTSGHLTLNPVVHMGWTSIIFLCMIGIAWGQMPVDPNKFRNKKWGNIIVSLAGPLGNLALSAMFIMFLKLELSIKNDAIFSQDFLYLAAYINFSLLIFNLLPVPPLDGYHVASNFFPKYQKFMQDKGYLSLFFIMILYTGGLSGLISILWREIICNLAPNISQCTTIF